jgi:hypothetical protein
MHLRGIGGEHWRWQNTGLIQPYIRAYIRRYVAV